MSNIQTAEVLDYLAAHLGAVNNGLQLLLDLLRAVPPDKTVQAAGVLALLQPLADEASQAAPLVQILGGSS